MVNNNGYVGSYTSEQGQVTVSFTVGTNQQQSFTLKVDPFTSDFTLAADLGDFSDVPALNEDISSSLKPLSPFRFYGPYDLVGYKV